MGVRANADGLLKRSQKLATALPVAERAGVNAAAAAAKRTIIAMARTRGVHARDGWVNVQERGGTRLPQAVVELRGSRAYWAEKGTKAHDIRPKRRKAIMTPAGPRASAHVRGAKARPFWREGVRASEKPAAAANANAIQAAMRSAFSG
jgi:hypothetical protein